MTPLKRLITTLVATAMALALMTAAAAVPARADSRSDDLAKALAAIAAVALIAKAIDKDDKPKARRPDIRVDPQLPAACALRIEGLRNERTAYSAQCLKSYGFQTRLPRKCAHDVRINGHRDRVYGKTCLARSGIYAEAHRGDRRGDRHWDDWDD